MLEALLGAGEASAFLENRFGQDWHRSHIGAHRASEYFGWSHLNRAIAEHRLVPPRLRLERGGRDDTAGLFSNRPPYRGQVLRDLDAAVLTERLRAGSTLIVDSVNELNPRLNALCEGLAAAFDCGCQTNLYASWGSTQGFNVHWDDHDVFVVQLDGQKRWDLYGVGQLAPTRRRKAPALPAPEELQQQCILNPGDVLYLPRGYWHAAVGLGRPTLHLTIGLRRKLGADLIHWLADWMLAEDVARKDLPLEQDDEALGAHVARLLSAIAAHPAAELGRLYRRHVEANQIYRPQTSFPHIGGSSLSLNACLKLAAGAVRLRIGAPGEPVVFSWRGVEFTLSAALAPVITALMDGRTLTLADLQSLAPDTKDGDLKAFASEMARRGAFLIDTGPEG